MFVTLFIESPTKQPYVIARKTIQRREGFFVFVGMGWRFSYPEGSLTVPIRAITHDEKNDSLLLYFDFCRELNWMISHHQTDWEILEDQDHREEILKWQKEQDTPAEGE
ncbi:MAG: hypothetical protein AAB358_03615 [Patescibacteria group bacterium]